MRIIILSRSASLGLFYHRAFASFKNAEGIDSVAKNTAITNACAIHSLGGELSRLAIDTQGLLA